MPRIRRKPEDSKENLLNAALRIASRVGYQNVRRDDIARLADVSPNLVTYHFNTMTQLKRDLIRHAIKTEALDVIAQGLAVNDPHARKVSDDVKARAAQLLHV